MANVSANCGYMMGPSINDLERNFKHITPSVGISYVDDAGNIGKGTVSRPQVIGKYKLKRVWVVIVDGSIYLHKRFGENCRFIVDLRKCQLDSVINSSCLRFTLKVDSFPGFEFDCIDTTDALCWKLAFYSAWRSVRESEYNFHALLASLKKTKLEKEKEDAEDDNFTVGSHRSLRSLDSQSSFRSVSSRSVSSIGGRGKKKSFIKG